LTISKNHNFATNEWKEKACFKNKNQGGVKRVRRIPQNLTNERGKKVFVHVIRMIILVEGGDWREGPQNKRGSSLYGEKKGGIK